MYERCKQWRPSQEVPVAVRVGNGAESLHQPLHFGLRRRFAGGVMWPCYPEDDRRYPLPETIHGTLDYTHATALMVQRSQTVKLGCLHESAGFHLLDIETITILAYAMAV